MAHHVLTAKDLTIGDQIAAMSAQLRRTREARTGIPEPEPVKEPAKQRKHKPRIARETAGPDEWLRLDDAARLAFPDGSMTVSGLRNEIRKGNLLASKRAGKIFTTLNAIDKMMREPCSSDGADERAKKRDYTSENQSDPAKRADTSSSTSIPPVSGSSEALEHLRTIAQGLKKPSRPISRKNTSRTSAKVIQFKS